MDLLRGDSLEGLSYSLVKHGNFSFRDLLIMTFIERKHYYDMLQEEFKKQKEEIDKAKTSRAR